MRGVDRVVGVRVVGNSADLQRASGHTDYTERQRVAVNVVLVACREQIAQSDGDRLILRARERRGQLGERRRRVRELQVPCDLVLDAGEVVRVAERVERVVDHGVVVEARALDVDVVPLVPCQVAHRNRGGVAENRHRAQRDRGGHRVVGLTVDSDRATRTLGDVLVERDHEVRANRHVIRPIRRTQ